MLLLLYDEISKRLVRAELALKKEDFELFDASVQRCVEIVNYLKDTLNFNYEISFELNRMYDFFLYQLSRLSAGRNPQIIEELHPLVKDLRDVENREVIQNCEAKIWQGYRRRTSPYIGRL